MIWDLPATRERSRCSSPSRARRDTSYSRQRCAIRWRCWWDQEEAKSRTIPFLRVFTGKSLLKLCSCSPTSAAAPRDSRIPAAALLPAGLCPPGPHMPAHTGRKNQEGLKSLSRCRELPTPYSLELMPNARRAPTALQCLGRVGETPRQGVTPGPLQPPHLASKEAGAPWLGDAAPGTGTGRETPRL